MIKNMKNALIAAGYALSALTINGEVCGTSLNFSGINEMKTTLDSKQENGLVTLKELYNLESWAVKIVTDRVTCGVNLTMNTLPAFLVSIVQFKIVCKDLSTTFQQFGQELMSRIMD